MPRVARFRLAAIGDLGEQLRYSPEETRRRQLDAVERLVPEIDPQRSYPQDYIVYRITGYRPEGAAVAETFRGGALLADLATLVQFLSLSSSLPADADGRTAMTVEDVARRWGVSTKTVQRFRRVGLLCHYVVFGDGSKKLAWFSDSVERFEAAHGERIRHAAGFSRLGTAGEQEIVQQARQLQQGQGVSLNEAARQLARRHGRAHETIRALLQRHDRGAAQPIFDRRGVLTNRQQRFVSRAARMGIPIAVLARRMGKTPMTIHRAINRQRASMLRDLKLGYIELATFKRADAEAVILASPLVRSGLPAGHAPSDAAAVVSAARAAGPVDVETEQPLIAAFNLLKRRARQRIGQLPRWPGSAQVDEIETDLRWAALLKQRLVELALPAAIRRIEANLGRALLDQPGDRIESLLRLAVQVISGRVEAINPGRRQRLERVCALAMDRELAQQEPRPASRRAAARHAPGAVTLAGLFDHLCPWQTWLELRPDWRGCAAELSAPSAHVIEQHFGLAGERPLGLKEVGRRINTSPTGVARLLSAAERELRELARRDAERAQR